MIIKQIIFLIFLVSIFSCVNKKENKSISFIYSPDSLLIKSVNYYNDHYNFKEDKYLDLLFSYIVNDSNKYQKLIKEIESDLINREKSQDGLASIKIRPIETIDCDEAYRFNLSRTFGGIVDGKLISGNIVITICQKDSCINLGFIIYRLEFEANDSNYLNPKYIIVKNKNKRLKYRDWEELNNKIDESYYWTMFPNEERHILDGSMWIIEGYIKNPKYWHRNNRTHIVKRLSPPKGSFYELGNAFVKLSDEKIGKL